MTVSRRRAGCGDPARITYSVCNLCIKKNYLSSILTTNPHSARHSSAEEYFCTAACCCTAVLLTYLAPSSLLLSSCTPYLAPSSLLLSSCTPYLAPSSLLLSSCTWWSGPHVCLARPFLQLPSSKIIKYRAVLIFQCLIIIKNNSCQ